MHTVWKMAVLPTVVTSVNAIPVKIQWPFGQTLTSHPKVHLELQGTLSGQSSFENKQIITNNNSLGELTQPHFKTC